MNKRFHILLASLCGAFLLTGCNQEPLVPEDPSEGVFTLKLQMPSDQEAETKIAVSEKPDGSKTLETAWQDDDRVQVLAIGKNEFHDLGRIPVSYVSPNRKVAYIDVDLRGLMSLEYPISLFMITGNEQLATIDSNDQVARAAKCTTPLQRTPIDKFRAPMYCEMTIDENEKLLGYFKPYGTFEVLHIYNETNEAIKFAHQGFNADTSPWYQASTQFWFYKGYDASPSGNTWPGEAESAEINIPAGGEGQIVSWYIPSGYPVNDAKLVASINGHKGLRTDDVFSSDVRLEMGHAYHMYAHWTGQEFRFGQPDPYEVQVITHPATDISIKKASISAEYTTTGYEITTYEQGFVYSSELQVPNLSNTACIKKKAEQMGSDFSATLTDLEPMTTYYVAAYVLCSHHNGEKQLFYGNVVSFVTDPLENVIPEDIVDEMDDHMPIHNGINPPVIEGQYVMSPLTLVFASDEGYYEPGYNNYYDLYLKFSNQDVYNNTLDYQEAQGSSTGTGNGAFISGEGDDFSVFFNVDGVTNRSYTIYTKEAIILSGTKTDQGIKNLYYAFVMLEKSDDPDNIIVDVGTYRVFNDGDGMSYPTNHFGVSKYAPDKRYANNRPSHIIDLIAGPGLSGR